MNAGSVENLIDSVWALPESVLRELAKFTLSGFNNIHQKANYYYGQLKLSNVLLNVKGKLKLNIEFSSKLCSAKDNKNVK